MADFQSLEKSFISEQVKIFAGSVDSSDKTKEFVKKLGIGFPVAFGMDAQSVSELTGAFYEKSKLFLQPTSFIIRPDKSIEVVVYSSGPVGRFVAQDVLSLIKFYKSQKKQ